MNPARHDIIGIARKLKLEWLELAVSLLREGRSCEEAREILFDVVEPYFESRKRESGSSVSRVVSMVSTIWLAPPPRLRWLHEEGVRLIRAVPPEVRIAVHWGMTTAVYPFWGRMAASAGRLLKLQGQVSLSQLKRRMYEHYGERQTVERSVQFVVRSFVEWGVMRDSSECKGSYLAGPATTVDDERLLAWLVEVFMTFEKRSIVWLRELAENPVFFPFRFPSPLPASTLAASAPRLSRMVDGGDDELLVLDFTKADGNAAGCGE